MTEEELKTIVMRIEDFEKSVGFEARVEWIANHPDYVVITMGDTMGEEGTIAMLRGMHKRFLIRPDDVIRACQSMDLAKRKKEGRL